MVRLPVGRPRAVHVERLPRRHQVGRRLLAASGMDHRRPVADARAPQAAAGPRPGAVPCRGRAAAYPRGHQPPRADALADAVRDRREVGRGARRSTSRTSTCPTAAPRSAARAARSTSSSGRPEPPGSCRACSRAASPARCSSTSRKARVQLPAADLDEHGRARLSYQQAEALFSEASGGATLHQLRHSALTHDAEDGTGTPMLMARTGHTSVRSLAKYARVSAEALQRHQAEHDPARRR